MRRTLKFISTYPQPQELLQKIETSEGWPYQINKEFYHLRDQALVSILYLLALRISEALRLRKNQFSEHRRRVVVKEIMLSKSTRKDKPRKDQFRIEGFLPLSKERAGFTDIIMRYLRRLHSEDRLFPFGRVRAWQITTSVLGIPNHWLRAFGEDYLYEHWDHDILAVADYVKVDPRTLQEYIRKRYQKYEVT